jgi:hypothetical protein
MHPLIRSRSRSRSRSRRDCSWFLPDLTRYACSAAGTLLACDSSGPPRKGLLLLSAPLRGWVGWVGFASLRFLRRIVWPLT